MYNHLTSAQSARPLPQNTSQTSEVFEIKVLRVHKTPMARHINEAQQICKTEGALHSKEEYTRFIIPTLSVSHQYRTRPQTETPTPTTLIDERNKRGRQTEQKPNTEAKGHGWRQIGTLCPPPK